MFPVPVWKLSLTFAVSGLRGAVRALCGKSNQVTTFDHQGRVGPRRGLSGDCDSVLCLRPGSGAEPPNETNRSIFAGFRRKMEWTTAGGRFILSPVVGNGMARRKHRGVKGLGVEICVKQILPRPLTPLCGAWRCKFPLPCDVLECHVFAMVP